MRLRTNQAQVTMTTGNEIALALRAAYLAIHRRTDARLATSSITADQFVLLATLSRGNAMTQRELARRMSSDPSTVRAMLVLLERRGLIRREAHPTDARARTVSLSPEGTRTFAKLWKATESLRGLMLRVLDPEEAETLVRLLTRFADSLNAAGVSAGESASSHSQEDLT